MKVLFAVSSENISEAIIKRYQKEYKEILSYKNVYYFNAILKEIQKDKTYDRIVISEDLEPFSNNNYETIDKFIFEKLDSISDEAQDSSGKETSIILICTDRRQKGNSILVKLFGIGVYNALLGNDRSMEEVCRLINRPRTKKEAKTYYRIDSEDVKYKAENENEVSEVEIQNILAHFKKLGKNTAKYSDSFNNIAVQYNDEQLRIIVNCLPINVKAVLEANCERYQELMAVTGGIPSVKNMVASTGVIEGAVKKEISSKSVGQAGNITRPIVIPSAVKNAKNQAQVLKKTQQSANQESQQVTEQSTEQIQQPVHQPVHQPIQQPMQQVQQVSHQQARQQTQQPIIRQQARQVVSNNDNIIDDVPTMPQSTVIQRRRRPVPGMSRTVSPIESQAQPEPKVQIPVQQEQEIGLQSNLEPELDEDMMLPGLEELPTEEFTEAVETTESNEVAEEYDELEDVEEIEDAEEATVKRGRGRPRKTPVEGVVAKPKGKRGRPRKNQDIEEIETEEEVTMLPGMEMEDDFNYDEPNEENSMLPGLEDEDFLDEDEALSDNEDVEEFADEDTTMLPGMEFEDEEATMLPGMGFEDEDALDEEVMDEEILPNNDETEVFDDDEAQVLPSVEEIDDDYTDEVALPGLDDLDDLDDISSRNTESEDDDTGLLPGFENIEENEEESDLLPGIGGDNNSNNYSNGISPSIEEDNGEIESIKSRVDYSMSSLNSLITKDKKIVTFIGTSKNGVSFLVNNLAALFSSLGINTAVLDMTKNKNSYYIYTKNEEELRNIAFNSIEKLQNGYAEGIRVDKNLSVYTALPNDGKDYSNAEPILSTLVQNHSLVLIDCDYDTDLTYFASCQEMYLVQSMDILTIQPLTAFLRELKTKGILEPEKIRVVINKELKVKSLSIKAIIGGLSYYNDPAMSFMTELFNKDMVKACTIPFEDNAYSKYLEGIVNCNISLNGFSKAFLSKLKVLGDMVYPLTSKQTYGKGQVPNYNQNAFSSSMNNTLNKMRKKY